MPEACTPQVLRLKIWMPDLAALFLFVPCHWHVLIQTAEWQHAGFFLPPDGLAYTLSDTPGVMAWTGQLLVALVYQPHTRGRAK